MLPGQIVWRCWVSSWCVCSRETWPGGGELPHSPPPPRPCTHHPTPSYQHRTHFITPLYAYYIRIKWWKNDVAAIPMCVCVELDSSTQMKLHPSTEPCLLCNIASVLLNSSPGFLPWNTNARGLVIIAGSESKLHRHTYIRINQILIKAIKYPCLTSFPN